MNLEHSPHFRCLFLSIALSFVFLWLGYQHTRRLQPLCQPIHLGPLDAQITHLLVDVDVIYYLALLHAGVLILYSGLPVLTDTFTDLDFRISMV